MKDADFFLLALKHRVAAFRKADGSELWSTALPGGGLGSSGNFITLVCDDACAYAYSGGRLYCLALSTGQLLWENGLSGYGYGLASLCVPGYPSGPDQGSVKHLMDQRAAAASAASGAG